MSQVIVGILAIVAFGLVAFPLFKNREEVEEYDGQEEDEAVTDVLSQREGVYLAIKELEADYQMGNLSDRDYHELRENYKLKAARVLKDMDELTAASQVAVQASVGGAAEAEAARRAGDLSAQPGVDDEIERTVRKLRKGTRERVEVGSRFCTRCGGPLAAGDRFCAGCGHPIVAGCPSCGAVSEPGEAFCAQCGAPLKGGHRG